MCNVRKSHQVIKHIPQIGPQSVRVSFVCVGHGKDRVSDALVDIVILRHCWCAVFDVEVKGAVYTILLDQAGGVKCHVFRQELGVLKYKCTVQIRKSKDQNIKH